MRNLKKSRGATAWLAVALLSAALAADAAATATSTRVYNFSAAGRPPSHTDQATAPTGNAPVPEPSTWASLAGLLAICAGLAASRKSKKPQG